MLLVGHLPYRFVVGFKEQFVRRISLESASGNGALQLFPLTVSRIVPMRYQLLLTCIKDEHRNMQIYNIKNC